MDLNLPLRTEILDKALKVEQNINHLLIVYLMLGSEVKDRKAITNKSGNLSFKNKIDLLFDLEILDKDEYKQFLLLMEFRNQFLHNIDCNSFEMAVSILGTDRGNNLLKFDDWKGSDDQEAKYRNAYNNLYGHTLKISLEKIRIRKKAIEDRSKLLQDLNNKSLYLIDFFFKLVNKLFEMYEPIDSDSAEVIETKLKILTTVGREIEKINETDEYKAIELRLGVLTQSDRMKKYLI